MNDAQNNGDQISEATPMETAPSELSTLDRRELLVILAEWRQSGMLLEGVLENANLEGCDLSDADLNDARLNGANLKGADLSRALLNRADLQDASLKTAVLKGASLTETNLSFADLDGADLTAAKLSSATLRNAKVSSEQLATAASLRFATMPDGTKYRGQFKLAEDLRIAETVQIDTSNDKAMASFYGVSVDELQEASPGSATGVDTPVRPGAIRRLIVHLLRLPDRDSAVSELSTDASIKEAKQQPAPAAHSTSDADTIDRDYEETGIGSFLDDLQEDTRTAAPSSTTKFCPNCNTTLLASAVRCVVCDYEFVESIDDESLPNRVIASARVAQRDTIAGLSYNTLMTILAGVAVVLVIILVAAVAAPRLREGSNSQVQEEATQPPGITEEDVWSVAKQDVDEYLKGVGITTTQYPCCAKDFVKDEGEGRYRVTSRVSYKDGSGRSKQLTFDVYLLNVGDEEAPDWHLIGMEVHE